MKSIGSLKKKMTSLFNGLRFVEQLSLTSTLIFRRRLRLCSLFIPDW